MIPVHWPSTHRAWIKISRYIPCSNLNLKYTKHLIFFFRAKQCANPHFSSIPLKVSVYSKFRVVHIMVLKLSSVKMGISTALLLSRMNRLFVVATTGIGKHKIDFTYFRPFIIFRNYFLKYHSHDTSAFSNSKTWVISHS